MWRNAAIRWEIHPWPLWVWFPPKLSLNQWNRVAHRLSRKLTSTNKKVQIIIISRIFFNGVKVISMLQSIELPSDLYWKIKSRRKNELKRKKEKKWPYGVFYAISVRQLFFIHPDDGIYKLRKWARGRKMFTLSSVQCPSSFLPPSYNISHGKVGRLFCFTRTFPTSREANCRLPLKSEWPEPSLPKMVIWAILRSLVKHWLLLYFCVDRFIPGRSSLRGSSLSFLV